MADPNLSRNAASSRAIPVAKLIEDVISDPAIPLFWGKNQKGMQAAEETDAPVFAPVPMNFGGRRLEIDRNKGRTPKEAWLNARDLAIMSAQAFDQAGYHKQIVNRLLEPFSHITVLVSATEWDNFLELRDHEDAEPHIQMLAREVRKCLEREDDIQELEPGEWHLPFVTVYEPDPQDGEWLFWTPDDGDDSIKLSTARCASTSYKTVDGFDMTLERAISLHDKLVSSKPIHASPAEHVAQADNLMDGPGEDGDLYQVWAHEREHGNFEGFRQYRHHL